MMQFAVDIGRAGGRPRYLTGRYFPPPGPTPDKQIAAAVGEVNKLVAGATEAQRLAVEQGHAVERCAEADEQARADAIRAGKPRPKPSVEATEVKHRELEEDAAAHWRAAELTAQDTLAVIEERGPIVAAKLRKQAAERREQLVAQLAEFEEGARALEEADQLASYLAPPDGILPDWERHAAKQSRLPRATVPRAAESGLTVADAVGLVRHILAKHAEASAPTLQEAA